MAIVKGMEDASMVDDLLACPACGSTFLCTFGSERIVFHVNSEREPVVIDMPEGLGVEQIRLEAIHCGACSWAGAVSQLVPGHS